MARVEACALDGSSHRIKKSKDETVGDRTGPRLGYSNPSYNPRQLPWSTSAFGKGLGCRPGARIAATEKARRPDLRRNFPDRRENTAKKPIQTPPAAHDQPLSD